MMIDESIYLTFQSKTKRTHSIEVDYFSSFSDSIAADTHSVIHPNELMNEVRHRSPVVAPKIPYAIVIAASHTGCCYRLDSFRDNPNLL